MDLEEFFLKLGKYVGIPIAILLVLSLIFRITFVTFIDNYEMGYAYNAITGELKALDKQGYCWSVPGIIRIHTIDLRPTQVCINANSRVLNCKLVQFDPAGWKTFVAWHGRADYDNQSGASGNLNQILMSYAYDGSGKTYPFLKILRELKPDDAPNKSDSTKTK